MEEWISICTNCNTYSIQSFFKDCFRTVLCGERECVCSGVYVCAQACEGESERERECVCVCVCARKRQREGESAGTAGGTSHLIILLIVIANLVPGHHKQCQWLKSRHAGKVALYVCCSPPQCPLITSLPANSSLTKQSKGEANHLINYMHGSNRSKHTRFRMNNFQPIWQNIVSCQPKCANTVFLGHGHLLLCPM